MKELLKTYKDNRKELFKKFFLDVLHIIPITNHKGTTFYAATIPSIYGIVYLEFLAPNFNCIERNGEKYAFCYNEFEILQYQLNQFLRNPKKYPMELHKDETLINKFLDSQYGKECQKKFN